MSKKLTETHRYVQLEEKIDDWRINTPKQMIEWLQKFDDSIPPEAENVQMRFGVEREYGYYDSVDLLFRVRIEYWVPLTEEELAKKAEESAARSKAAKAAAAKKRREREKLEREQYERLKAKFEKAE